MKKVFITGSSSGLGKALAEAYLTSGDKVFGISRHKEIEHPNYHHIYLDLSDPEVYRGFKLPSFESNDEVVWINNAGSLNPVAKVGNYDHSQVESTYHVNVLAPIFFIDLLRKASTSFEGSIHVLNISSGAARYPVEGWGTYCSSKAALDAFAAVADKETRDLGNGFHIRNIYPGIIDTPMQGNIRRTDNENFPEVKRFIEYKNDGKLTNPEVVASGIIRNFNSFFMQEEVAFPIK